MRVILKRHNEIFLVKHPYDDFWVFPGGGIQKNETVEAAAIREVMEETSYSISEPIVKLGEYANNSKGKDDTVTVFVAENFFKHETKRRLLDEVEIQKSGWFEVDHLPELSSATRKRIAEIRYGKFSENTRDWN